MQRHHKINWKHTLQRALEYAVCNKGLCLHSRNMTKRNRGTIQTLHHTELLTFKCFFSLNVGVWHTEQRMWRISANLTNTIRHRTQRNIDNTGMTKSSFIRFYVSSPSRHGYCCLRFICMLYVDLICTLSNVLWKAHIPFFWKHQQEPWGKIYRTKINVAEPEGRVFTGGGILCARG